MSFADPTHLAGSYDGAASTYAQAFQSEEDIPHSKIENDMVAYMLGDCTNSRVLDIGGGSGGHARQALDAGAVSVDVVDISPGMLQVGQELEKKLGRDAIGWHVGNAFESIHEQLPSLPLGGYDIVMIIWPIDHVANVNDVEKLWKNVAAYLKPGGRFAGIRVANAWSESARTGKYGSSYHHIEDIPGGIKYKYTVTAQPPFTLDASSMKTSYSGSTELPNRFGIEDIAVVDPKVLRTVKSNPGFWEMFCNDPHFVGFMGVKK